MKVGILALQGDFELHQKMMQRLNVDHLLVKTTADLEKCDGLIIPGGESTTFMHLIDKIGLKDAITKFLKNKPVFGTCAGSIILAKQVIGETRYETFKAIDIEIQRNAYGRQIDSFVDEVRLDPLIDRANPTFEGVFIRAPKFLKIGKNVRPLAYHRDDVVMAESDNILVATFHPELTEDTRIHQYFISKIES
jgi:5'-phosphate synthase pdxT subunit